MDNVDLYIIIMLPFPPQAVVTMEPSVSSPASLTVHVCFPGARAAVMDNLNRQREEGRLCDLSIQVQGQVFRAHRCVLAASSPYFHDQVGGVAVVAGLPGALGVCEQRSPSRLPTGVAEERHHRVAALRHGPGGL